MRGWTHNSLHGLLEQVLQDVHGAEGDAPGDRGDREIRVLRRLSQQLKNRHVGHGTCRESQTAGQQRHELLDEEKGRHGEDRLR